MEPGGSGTGTHPGWHTSVALPSQDWHERVLFGYSVLRDASGMAPIDQKQQAERRMTRILEDNGLPLPDEVQYGETCVRFLWYDRKVAVVVDLEDFDEIDADGGYEHDGLAA